MEQKGNFQGSECLVEYSEKFFSSYQKFSKIIFQITKNRSTNQKFFWFAVRLFVIFAHDTWFELTFEEEKTSNLFTVT